MADSLPDGASGSDFAPGVAEQLAAIEAGTLTAAPEKDAPTVHDVRFLGTRERSRKVDLEWPLSFDGREFRSVCVRRISAGKVAEYLRTLTDDSTGLSYPYFCDEAGADLPDGLLDALDDDDQFILGEAVRDFLPRRFRDLLAAQPATPTPDTPNPGTGASFVTSAAAPTGGA